MISHHRQKQGKSTIPAFVYKISIMLGGKMVYFINIALMLEEKGSEVKNLYIRIPWIDMAQHSKHYNIPRIYLHLYRIHKISIIKNHCREKTKFNVIVRKYRSKYIYIIFFFFPHLQSSANYCTGNPRFNGHTKGFGPGSKLAKLKLMNAAGIWFGKKKGEMAQVWLCGS